MRSRRRAVVIPAVLVVIALATTAAVWFRSNQDPPPVAQDRLGPVLLVPGRTADSVALVDLQKRLFLTGRRAMIVSTGISDTGDLQDQAKEIQAAAEKMIATGAPSVDVIGYSGGGVVTRIWMAQGGAALARRVITIGSPNQGATGAGLNNLVTKRYCEVTCPQLTPGSALLKGLPTATTTPPWLNVWTARDRVVPEPSAQLSGAMNIALEDVCANSRSGHAAMPSDPLLIGIVLKALSAAPLTGVPTEADCNALRRDGTPDLLPGVAATTPAA